MSTYTKMVMLPMDVYHNLISSNQQVAQPVPEIRPVPIKNNEVIKKSKPKKKMKKDY